MEFDNTEAVNALAAMPPEPPKPTSKWNGWSAPLRAIPAAAAEMGATALDAAKGYGQVMGSTGAMSAGGMFSLQSDAEKRDAEIQRAKIQKQGTIDTDSRGGQLLRDTVDYYRPDPVTAGLAEKLAFEFPRFAIKAATYTAVAGPVGGATLLGTDEGMKTSAELNAAGVDQRTRLKVAGVTGAASAAGLLLPVAAPGSIAKTAGLWAVGGPGAFVAQQAATKEILQDANYGELAQQYDPLDPVGLAVSALVPAAFAIHGARASTPTKSGTKKKANPETASIVSEPTKLTPDQVDAVMTHNLTLTRDVREATPPAEAMKLMQSKKALPDLANEHIQRLPESRRQSMVDMYSKAEQVKPMFDSTARSIADAVGGTVKLAELKGVDRAVDKVAGDYAGDPSKIKDLVRATLVVDSAEAAQKAVAEVMTRYEVLPSGQRNLLDPNAKSLGGYRDAKFNVLIDGHVAEIQVNVPGMLGAKKEAHPLYKQMETLKRQWDGKEMPPEVAAKISELRDGQRKIYDTAWAEVTNSRNLSKETTTPLRSAESDGKTRGGSVSQAMEYLTPGQSGLRDTGMPSTSSNSALGPNAGSSMGASDASIVPSARETSKQAPNVKSAQARAEEVLRVTPDFVVGQDADGKPITAKQALEQIRKESREGTDTELGTQDAGLLEVAANCALATGTM